MAILERVTITGADDSISPDSLAALSHEFPFVEWGILVSANNESTPRYPSRKWMDRLCDWYLQRDFRVAVHVQGRWLRSLLYGDSEDFVIRAGTILGLAKRFQFNFHGGKIGYNSAHFALELNHLPFARKQLIFQHDGCMGQEIMLRVIAANPILNCVAFYDMSHGAGVLPDRWPESQYPNERVGYAGGLGPENVIEQLPLIAKAAGQNRFWVDMETKVRTDLVVASVFDLDKAERVLELCAPFIGKEIS